MHTPRAAIRYDNAPNTLLIIVFLNRYQTDNEYIIFHYRDINIAN